MRFLFPKRLAALGVFASLIAAGTYTFPRIQAEPQGNWSSDQRLIIKSAANKAINRMFTDKVMACAKRNARKDHPSKQFWSRVEDLRSSVKVAVVKVNKLGMACPTNGTATLGRAFINTVKSDTNNEGENTFHF